MIEGLKFLMQPQELREHLMARIDHHIERAAWYRQKAEELKAGGVEAANMTGGDPVGALQQKQKQHDNRVRTINRTQRRRPECELRPLARCDVSAMPSEERDNWRTRTQERQTRYEEEGITRRVTSRKSLYVLYLQAGAGQGRSMRGHHDEEDTLTRVEPLSLASEMGIYRGEAVGQPRAAQRTEKHSEA